MRRLAWSVAVAVLALLSFAGTAFAQSGVIRGRITDSTGAALPRVQVSVDNSNLVTTTNDQGDYWLRGVAAGVRVIRARLIGFRPQTATVQVTVGAEVRQDFRMVATPIGLAAIDVVIGSRARHAAGEELAVPVDIFTAEDIQNQGTTETSQILQALSPSVNFPHQSVTDATDIARPFTLRGLSPDQTLVLLNGYRRHQMSIVNTFAYGMPAGSSGADLNTIPSSAIDRIEVLRDGAAAQYGSDAIAGVVNIVLKEAPFAPFINASAGVYETADYPSDGVTTNVSGGYGLRLGGGSLSLFAEYMDRQPTNRAWADPFDASGNGQLDSVSADGKVTQKNNQVPQPNQHWGDGLERDINTMFNMRLPTNLAGTAEVFAFGGYSTRTGAGQGYRRYETDARNWPQIYNLGFLPEFHPDVTDYSLAGGYRSLWKSWSVEIGGVYGHNDFQYNLDHTLNTSLGPSTTVATAPGDDGILGNGDDPGIPNQTSFFAGAISRDEVSGGLNFSRAFTMNLKPVNVAFGVQARWEKFGIQAGELASYIDGGHLAQDSSDATGGSQVFAGFSPSDAVSADRTNIGAYADVEMTISPLMLIDIAGRFENYSDFGSRATGKFALRYQPSRRFTLRAATSAGFRAPGLGQSHFSKIVTNVIGGNPVQVGVYPVDNPAAKALGSQPLKEETSINVSAGVAISPNDQFSFTADLFGIDITNRIILGATFDDDTTLAVLARNGITNIGGVQYFTNGVNTRTQGVDLTANYRIPMGRGNLDFTGMANYTKTEIRRVAPLPPVLANSTEPGLLDTVTTIAITQERPDWRASLAMQYTTGRFHGLLRGSYYGKFSSAQPGFCDTCRENYGAKTLLDAELGYRLGPVDWALGARNLLDTYPDRATQDFNNNFATFPWAAASPFGYNGRYVYTRFSVAFR